MSDTLREALEELAGRLDRVAKTVAYDGATREVEGLEDLATELRSILAAHPADTTTEWGVAWEHVSMQYPAWTSTYTSKELAQSKLGGSAFPGALVSRQVTPWRVSK